MREPITVLKSLPKYEVFLEESKRCPELDASACYVFLQLLRTGEDLIAMDELILSSLGTRHGRFVLLMLLHKHGPGEMTPAELADKTCVTRATISGLLDGLEKDGLVERRPDPEDRRLIRLFLTPAGNQLLQKARPTYCEWFANVIAPLTEDERKQLVNILQKLQQRLAELGARLPDSLHTATAA
jgi:DNA-binding MarR family transcriptional regulator